MYNNSGQQEAQVLRSLKQAACQLARIDRDVKSNTPLRSGGETPVECDVDWYACAGPSIARKAAEAVARTNDLSVRDARERLIALEVKRFVQQDRDGELGARQSTLQSLNMLIRDTVDDALFGGPGEEQPNTVTCC